MREAARVFGLHRDTVRKMLAFSVPPGYRRQSPPKRPTLPPPFTLQLARIALYLCDPPLAVKACSQSANTRHWFSRLLASASLAPGSGMAASYYDCQSSGYAHIRPFMTGHAGRTARI